MRTILIYCERVPHDHHFATGTSRTDYSAASEILDALAATRPDWHADAACREHPELSWFPDPCDTEAVEAARAVCGACLVAEECEAAARINREQAGVWAGVLRVGRRRPKVA